MLTDDAILAYLEAGDTAARATDLGISAQYRMGKNLSARADTRRCADYHMGMQAHTSRKLGAGLNQTVRPDINAGAD
jgi:hypothetical protein